MSEAHVALVAGASGGIGGALAAALVRSGAFTTVVAASRRAVPVEGATPVALDVTDEGSIAAAAATVRDLGPLRLAIVATGALTLDGVGPEKALRELDAERLLRAYRVNAIGPALLAKHLVPSMPRRERSVFAAISAKVGSIEDNRLGGWHAYRASKSGLNMLVRTIAVELARTHPGLICATLHPGTVATGLSQPFRSGVPADRLRQPGEAAERLLAVIDRLTPADTGRFFSWDGSAIPF